MTLKGAEKMSKKVMKLSSMVKYNKPEDVLVAVLDKKFKTPFTSKIAEALQLKDPLKRMQSLNILQ